MHKSEKMLQKGARMGAEIEKIFAPGPCAAHRRGVLALGVSAVYLSSMHPFPAVGLVLQYSFFF